MGQGIAPAQDGLFQFTGLDLFEDVVVHMLQERLGHILRSQDCELVGIIRHHVDQHPRDLLVTAIFMTDKSQIG